MKHLIATAVLSCSAMAYANTSLPNYNTDSHLYEFTQCSRSRILGNVTAKSGN